MRLQFTAEASADLLRIGDYIAERNPNSALEFVRHLRETCAHLTSMPAAYPLVPRFERFGVRKRVTRNYLVFYCAAANHVLIIRILHGAQDYELLLEAAFS